MKKESVLKLNKLGLLIFFLSIGFWAPAQEEIDFEKYKKDYKGQPEVILDDYEKYYIEHDKKGIYIWQEKRTESLVLNDLGTRNYKDQFYSSELSPILDYKAYIINNDNKKIKVKDFNHSAGASSSVFYDDVEKIEVTYTGLEPGFRKVLNYETEFTDPNLLHRYIFKKSYAAENMTLEVEIDNGLKLGYKIINDSGDIEFTKEVKRKKTLYRWTRKNSTSYKWESKSPSMLYIEPHIVIYVEENEKNKEAKLLGDVPKLYAYYQTFIENLNKDVNQELIDIANDVTKDLESEEEKVKAIYYWVKDNIKYIAYENGYEGFIPREANVVCERKFGDCKDMSSITKAMCNSIGIENVKLVWIGTRDIPYTYEEVPTPAVDNHMIACYVKGDEVIFLDATDSYTAYPHPSGFIQGKEALIAMSDDEYKLAKVPVVSGEENKKTITVNFHVEDKIIKGNGAFNFHGLSRSYQIMYRDSDNEKARFNDIKRGLNLGNNKFKLEKYTEENVEERDSSYTINFDFNLENYVIEVGKEQYINMFLRKHSILDELEEDRKNPCEFNLLQLTDVKYNFDMQDNQKIEELPDAIDIDNDLLSFHAKYSLEGQRITLAYTLELKKILLQPEDFSSWNETVEKINDYMENTLTIINE